MNKELIKELLNDLISVLIGVVIITIFILGIFYAVKEGSKNSTDNLNKACKEIGFEEFDSLSNTLYCIKDGEYYRVTYDYSKPSTEENKIHFKVIKIHS